MTEQAPALFVVRVPETGWPGPTFGDLLGERFIVTATTDLVADVVLLDGATVAEVEEHRRRQPEVGVVVHSVGAEAIEMLNAGADAVVALEPLVEVAARVQAVLRRLPSGRRCRS